MLFVELKSNFIGDDFLFSMGLESCKDQLIERGIKLARVFLKEKMKTFVFIKCSLSTLFKVLFLDLQ